MIPMREPTVHSLSLVSCASFLMLVHAEPLNAIMNFTMCLGQPCPNMFGVRYVSMLLIFGVLILAIMHWVIARSAYDREWGPAQRKLIKCFMAIIIYFLELTCYCLTAFYLALGYLMYLRSTRPLGISYAISTVLQPTEPFNNETDLIYEKIGGGGSAEINILWFQQTKTYLCLGFAWCWVAALTLLILVHILGLLITASLSLD